jgi:valyl-tRNA synthetase
MAIVNNTKLFVPIAGLIDVEQEVSRLEKEIEKMKNKDNSLLTNLIMRNLLRELPSK